MPDVSRSPRGTPAVQTKPRRRGRRLLLSLVAAPVLAALLAGLAAPYVGGAGSWAMQLVAIGLPYVAWAAAALSLLALAARLPGWAVGLAVPAVLVALRAWPGTAEVPARAAAAEALVLTSFNVPQARPYGPLADSMVAFATRTEPHLLAVQDTWVYPGGSRSVQAVHVRALVEQKPYRIAAPDRLNPRQGWQRRGMGTPLLVRTDARAADSLDARVEIVEQEEIALGRADDVSLALRTRFRWRGREAVLYNVHLRSFGEPKPWRDPDVDPLQPSTWRPYLSRYRTVFAERHAETDQLAERLSAETLPVIIAGDFNSTADHYTLRRLRRARNGQPFEDAYRQAAGWQWGRTYHAGRPLVRIDFVLVDPDAFDVTQARTYPVAFSDHRPVEVHLRWREAARE